MRCEGFLCVPRFHPAGNETFCRAANARSRRGDAPASRKSRSGRGSDVNVVVQIPYRCLPRAWVEQQVIWMTVEIKVRHTYYVPPGPSSGPEGVADAHVIVKIPYRCLPRIGIDQEVIWMTVEIKVRQPRYAPPGPRRGPERVADTHVIVKIPYRCLPRIGID